MAILRSVDGRFYDLPDEGLEPFETYQQAFERVWTSAVPAKPYLEA